MGRVFGSAPRWFSAFIGDFVRLRPDPPYVILLTAQPELASYLVKAPSLRAGGSRGLRRSVPPSCGTLLPLSPAKARGMARFVLVGVSRWLTTYLVALGFLGCGAETPNQSPHSNAQARPSQIRPAPAREAITPRKTVSGTFPPRTTPALDSVGWTRSPSRTWPSCGRHSPSNGEGVGDR